MLDKLPNERQLVEVRLGNDWQAATYVDGEFIDMYGMPINPHKISTWRMPIGLSNRRGPAAPAKRTH
jgi:hypothetical protein